MVKKTKSTAPASKTAKKVPSKSKKNVPKQTSEPISNGYSDTAFEHIAEEPTELPKETSKKQPQETKENQPGSSNGSEENEMKSATKMTPESVKSDIVSTEVAEPLPKSRKRKATDVVVKEKSKSAPVKAKAKRQKITLDIPQARSIPGKVFVVGENDVGQLGLGEDVEVQRRPALLDLSQSVVDVAAGGMHSVCLTESGEVITFGCNDEGALGRVTTDDASEKIPNRVDITERVIQISAGDSHSAALTESGKVYLWGNFRNVSGQMGLTADGSKKVTPIRILNDITIVKISSGSDHLVCLSTEGVVYTCGNGESGQLGRIPERFCQNGGRGGLATLVVPGEVHVTRSNRRVFIDEVWTGASATVLKQHGSNAIYAFGLNNYDQLGYENERATFKPKQVLSFNTNLQGQTWLHINGDLHHTLALDDRGLVYALGRGDYGRLGLGENAGHVSKPTVIPTLQNENCLDISCGNCASFAVTEQGSVYSWGMGDNHALGHGNDNDYHIPKLIEGNFLNSWKALKVEGGGQHTLILACSKENMEKRNK